MNHATVYLPNIVLHHLHVYSNEYWQTDFAHAIHYYLSQSQSPSFLLSCFLKLGLKAVQTIHVLSHTKPQRCNSSNANKKKLYKSCIVNYDLKHKERYLFKDCCEWVAIHEGKYLIFYIFNILGPHIITRFKFPTGKWFQLWMHQTFEVYHDG